VVGKLKLVGLTGGIGTGKSTVGRMMKELGIPVLDADVIARTVVGPGRPAHAEIARAFPGVIDDLGQVDRKRLGALVFADPEARRRLEAITHPRIQEEALAQAAALEAAGHRLAFYEASLLVETNRHREFDGLVVVVADEAQQVSRTMARDRCTEAQARARIAAQLPLAQKRTVATDVIENRGDLATTRAQVEALVQRWRAA
jgi:dephospho-CoA kinase